MRIQNNCSRIIRLNSGHLDLCLVFALACLIMFWAGPLHADDSQYPGPDDKVEISSRAVRIKTVYAEYDQSLKDQGIEGDVWVKALVDREGSVVRVLIHKSSGNVRLDSSAARAARGSEYRPATFRGIPVATWDKYMVIFELPDTPPPPKKQPRKPSPPSVPTGDSRPGIDDFVPVEKIAEMIYEEQPNYPWEAKRKGIQGEVWVKALVGEKGKVLDAVIYRSSGSKLLDDATLEAAYKYKYRPAIQDSKPVAMWVAYKVVFSLSQ